MKFTKEEMIVVSVWYHERRFTNMDRAGLEKHFLKRFGKEAPLGASISKWEQRLFSSNIIYKTKKTGTKLKRFTYIPYILESLAKHPDLNAYQRAKLLGLNPSTLGIIMKTEMKGLQEFIPKIGEESSKNSSEQDTKQSTNTKAKNGGS